MRKRLAFLIAVVPGSTALSAPPPPAPTILQLKQASRTTIGHFGVVVHNQALAAPVVGAAPAAVPKRVYFTPTPVNPAASIILPGGVHSTWGALTQDQTRQALSLVDEDATFEQQDNTGSVTSILGGVNLNRGTYRVTYFYYRYRTLPCDPVRPFLGAIAVGTGIRIIADVTTLKGGVSVTGLIPVAAAVETNRAQGTLGINSVGLASGTASISSYLNAGGANLSADGIRTAVESMGVVKAVSDTPNVIVTPYYLFVESTDVPACMAAFRP